ncbi:VOC family protein [Rosistilla ulvae]|nr:VOC family protein [Rosistilla ulvae]
MQIAQKITPSLSFENQAEEAASCDVSGIPRLENRAGLEALDRRQRVDR